MSVDALLGSIFQESAGSASVVPFISSVTLEAMQRFGGYTLTGLPLFAAFGGNVAGCLFNWLVGAALYWLRTKVTFLGRDAFPAAKLFFHRYGWALCAFFWLPLGSILLVIAGFFRAPLWKVATAAAVGSALHLWMFIHPPL